MGRSGAAHGEERYAVGTFKRHVELVGGFALGEDSCDVDRAGESVVVAKFVLFGREAEGLSLIGEGRVIAEAFEVVYSEVQSSICVAFTD